MLEQIIEYLQNCPLLSSALGQDFLSQDDGAAGVQLLSCEPILQQYADGGSLRQAMFRIFFREGGRAEENCREKTYHQVAAWLENNEAALPELEEGQTAQKMEVVTMPALSKRQFGGNCYSMDGRLIYYQKGV